jgi:hypothetical protein
VAAALNAGTFFPTATSLMPASGYECLTGSMIASTFS